MNNPGMSSEQLKGPAQGHLGTFTVIIGLHVSFPEFALIPFRDGSGEDRREMSLDPLEATVDALLSNCFFSFSSLWFLVPCSPSSRWVPDYVVESRQAISYLA